jgi:spermidine/putrescine transport system permease protein
MIKSRFCLSVTTLVFIFLYLPIILLIINSFNDSKFGSVWTGFTFKWYQKLFSEPEVWEAFVNSLIVGFSSTIASTVIGTAAACALFRYKSPLQAIHYTFIYSPLIIPDILMGISLLLFFVALNVKLGLFTIFLAHTTFCISYVAMLMLSKLQNFDFTVVEAAQDLGANKIETIKRVLLPLMAPGLTAAALLSFTLSIDDFVITFFVAGEGATTLPLYIYSMIKYGSTPIINALSTIILFITVGLVLIYHTFASEENL